MKKEIKYVATKEELKEAKDKAFNKLNAKTKVDGFRKGKTPRNVFEKKYPGEIVMEAANSLIDKKYREIIYDNELKVILEPKINITKLDDDNLEATFIVITEPTVELGEYKNLDVKKKSVKVTKEEVNNKVNELLKSYAELVVKEKGKVDDGDIAIIDFEGFKDGVAFDGGKGENYSLEIGSNTFIPGFEDGVKGMKQGETKDIELVFPEDYGATDLAGKPVVFKVTVNEIKVRQIPELNEDFFADLDMKGVTSKEELEKKIKGELKEEKEEKVENEYTNDVIAKARDNMKVEIDDEIVDAEAEHMYDDFLERMKAQGISEDLYLEYANTTKEDIINHMKEEAMVRIKNSYLLHTIVKKENIKVTDEDVKKEINDIASKYKVTEEEVLKEIGGIDMIKDNLEIKKAINIMKGE